MNQINGWLTGCENVKIFWQSWQAAEPVANIVISHGLGEHGARYTEFAKVLVAQGFNVYAIDHRGHGHSYGHRGAITRFQYCIDDLNSLIEQIKAEQDLPLILFGHSMGGAVATGYTLQYQEKLAALILSGPGVSANMVSAPLRKVIRLLSRVWPNLPIFKVAPTSVSRDPQTVQDYIADPLNLSRPAPVHTINEMVEAAAEMQDNFERIKLPTLILHGAEDKLIPAEASTNLYKKITSPQKQLNIYPDLYHEILNELPAARQAVIKDICVWLSEQGFG